MNGETRQTERAPRAVLLCSAAFFCVCALCTALLGLGLWPALLVSGAAAFALSSLALLAQGGRWRAVAVGLLLGLLCVWGHGLLSWRPALALAGRSGLCRVALTEAAQGYGGYGVAWGRLLDVESEEAGYPVKVYLRDGSPDYQPGDLLTVQAVLRAAPTGPRAGMVQRGVLLTVRQTGELSCATGGAASALTRLRLLAAEVRARVSVLLSGDEAGLLSAMLTGESGGCSDSFLRALAAAGLTHVTAVSGLHLSILAGFLIRVLGRRAGVWLSLPVVFTYAALAGFPASAVRAAVMQGFVLLAFLLRRDNDSPTALSAALLLLCAVTPGASLSAGLLLSFAATAGILWLSPALAARLLKKQPKNRLLRSLARYAANTLAVSTAATVFTVPVTLAYFGSVSLIALPMNLLCLWAVGLSLLLGVGALCLTALLPAAAPVCGFVLQWPLRYLTALVGLAGRQPWATAQAGIYAALGAAVLLLGAAALRGRTPTRRALPLCAGLLCLCVGLSALETRLVTRVAVGDAGGAPILALRSGGETAFVGCGASDYAAGRFIRAEMTRASSGGSAFLLAAGGGWRQLGGAAEALSASGAPALTVPAGVFPRTGDSGRALWYTEGGSLSLNRLKVSLLTAGDGYLCLVSGPGLALLSLCGTEPWAAAAALAETPCAAPVLLLDESFVTAPAALARVCARTGAQAIILSDGGFSTPPARLCGLPVLALSERGTITLETAR